MFFISCIQWSLPIKLRFLLLTFYQLSQMLSESRLIYTSLTKLDSKFPVNEQRVYHLCKKLLVIGSRKKKLATRKVVVWLRIHLTSWMNYVKLNTLRLIEYVSIHNQEWINTSRRNIRRIRLYIFCAFFNNS